MINDPYYLQFYVEPKEMKERFAKPQWGWQGAQETWEYYQWQQQVLMEQHQQVFMEQTPPPPPPPPPRQAPKEEGAAPGDDGEKEAPERERAPRKGKGKGKGKGPMKPEKAPELLEAETAVQEAVRPLWEGSRAFKEKDFEEWRVKRLFVELYASNRELFNEIVQDEVWTFMREKDRKQHFTGGGPKHYIWAMLRKKCPEACEGVRALTTKSESRFSKKNKRKADKDDSDSSADEEEDEEKDDKEDKDAKDEKDAAA